MPQKTTRLFRYLVSAFGLGAVIGWSLPSDAYIQQIVIDQTTTVNFTPITFGNLDSRLCDILYDLHGPGIW